MAKGITVPTIFTASDKMSPVIDKIANKTSSFGSKIGSIVGQIAIGAGISKSFNDAMQFEDKLADVAKVTNLTSSQIKGLGNDMLDLSTRTRTTATDLVSIAEELGRLGIAGNEIQKLIPQANKFNIALSKDYSGGMPQAIQDVTKATRLFKETRDLPVVDAFTKMGDAINYATTKGAKAENINDYILRLGTLNEKIRPGFDSVVALGVAFEKTGIDSQIAASGMTGVLSNLGQETKKVSQFLKICEKDVISMFNVDPGNLFFRVAHQLSAMTGSDQMKAIKEMGMNSNEMKKVLGAIASKGGWKEYTQMFSDLRMGKSTGSIAKEAERKEATTLARWQKLMNKLMVVSVKLGEAMFPIFEKIADSITPILKGTSDFIKNNKDLTTTILALGASSWAIWKVYQAYKFLTGALTVFKVAEKGLIGSTLFSGTFTTSSVIGSIDALTASLGTLLTTLTALSVVALPVWLNQKFQNRTIASDYQEIPGYKGSKKSELDSFLKQEQADKYNKKSSVIMKTLGNRIPEKNYNSKSDIIPLSNYISQLSGSKVRVIQKPQEQQVKKEEQKPQEVHVVLKGNTEAIKETFSPSPSVKIKMSSTFNNKNRGQ